jgi:hypothetical protein
MRGSTLARNSPRLIAACHVLHRLLAPRHPPDALLSRSRPVPPPPPSPSPPTRRRRQRTTEPAPNHAHTRARPPRPTTPTTAAAHDDDTQTPLTRTLTHTRAASRAPCAWPAGRRNNTPPPRPPPTMGARHYSTRSSFTMPKSADRQRARTAPCAHTHGRARVAAAPPPSSRATSRTTPGEGERDGRRGDRSSGSHPAPPTPRDDAAGRGSGAGRQAGQADRRGRQTGGAGRQAGQADRSACALARRRSTTTRARGRHVGRPTAAGWRRSDSNRRPPACKAGALPLSYAPTGPTPRVEERRRHRAATDGARPAGSVAPSGDLPRPGAGSNGPGRT